MDRRLHPRHPVNLDGRITDIAATDHFALAHIVDISESGVCANLVTPFAPGAIVKIEIADCSLFGQVSYCHTEGPSFVAGIEIVRVLIGESDLSRLVNTMLIEALPNTPGIRVA